MATPLQAIRKHCLECLCGSRKEVGLCLDVECNLHPYRFGHNPKRKGIGSAKSFNNSSVSGKFLTKRKVLNDVYSGMG